MSPPRLLQEPDPRASQALVRVAAAVGVQIRDARLTRRWTVRELASSARVDQSELAHLESGRVRSLGPYARVATALGLRLEVDLVDPRRKAGAVRFEDVVHSAMGDVQAGQFAGHRLPTAIDEPFQHFQFAGRADVLAWSLEHRSLVHIESRTRFPNLQDVAGSYNAKRSYLAPVIAQRIGLSGGFRSVTHAMVGLWSSEVLHAVRLRTATFRALCPESIDAFTSWWEGTPLGAGTSSAFVLFDPVPRSPARRFVDLDAAIRVDARYRGYAEAAAALADKRQ